jgi:hypothetical protein
MLNKTCDIEHGAVAQDTQTGAQKLTWQPLHLGVCCRLRARAVSERKYGDVNYQKATHALYIQKRRLAKKHLRVALENKYFDVIGYIDLGGADKYLCLYLERYKA